MSDHKFERQVRQKLGDLKLTPTPESWEKIENEIRERKRRRVPIFWLPLLLLGLGAGGYLLLAPGEEKKTTAHVLPVPATAPQTEGKAGVGTTGRQRSEAVNETSATTTPQLTNTTQSVRNKDAKRGNEKGRGTLPGIEEGHRSAGEKISNEPGKKQPDEPSAQEESEHRAVQQRKPGQDETTTTPATTSQQPKKLITEEKTSTQETPKPAERKKQDKKDNKKKWSFGVTGSAGVSAISEGKFVSFSGAQVEDVRATPNLSGNFFGSPMVAAPPPAPPPSKLEPTFSYSIGATAKRELSKRFALSAGVSYLQMNTVTKVGYQVNNRQIVNNDLGYNVVDRYYLPSQDYVNKYKNRYHFLEIPVTLHTRLNRSQKLPIYWNAGVSANILLGSNALHYDGNTGVYYKDEALLNQVQGGVSTGFSFSLFNKTKTPLWIGPTARYNFSPVLKRSVSTSKNLMGLGVDLRWYLK